MSVAAISTDSTADAKKMADLVGAEFHILADTTTKVSQSFGVFNMLGDGVAAPATIIVRPDGTVGSLHVGRDIGDRPSAVDILGEVDRILR